MTIAEYRFRPDLYIGNRKEIEAIGQNSNLVVTKRIQNMLEEADFRIYGPGEYNITPEAIGDKFRYTLTVLEDGTGMFSAESLLAGGVIEDSQIQEAYASILKILNYEEMLAISYETRTEDDRLAGIWISAVIIHIMNEE